MQRQRLGEVARDGRFQRVAVNDFDRSVDRFHVGLGERPPAAAHGKEHRPREGELQPVAENLVDLALGGALALREHRLDRKGAERQTDPGLSHMVVDRLRHLETAAAHVADSPDRAKESGDDAERRIARLFGARQDANPKPGLGGDCGRELRPVGRAADRLGRGHVQPGDAHRVGDGAKPPGRLDGSPKSVGRDRPRLRQALGQPAQRLFVEARHRSAAELVVDDEPHRVRSDVDDRIMGPLRADDARGIEIERPLWLRGQMRFLRLDADHAHRRRSWPVPRRRIAQPAAAGPVKRSHSG